MNERIEKLAAQAAKFSAVMALPTGESGDKLFVEKFALLIVQECANWVRTNYDSWGAEPLAFSLEKDFGLHGDYAE